MRTLVLIVALLTAGCPLRAPSPADTLIVGLSAPPATLDPRLATDATGVRIGGLIFESLVHVGHDFQIEGEAARSWVRRGRTFTFTLRPDIRFHDGRPLTVADVLSSFDYYRGPRSPFHSTLRNIVRVDARAEGPSLVVKIELDGGAEKFLGAQLPSVRLLPAGASDPLMGTGPYRFAGEGLNEIRLESVRAATPHLRFKFVRDDYTRYLKLRQNEIDLVLGDLPLGRVREFRERGFRVWQTHGLAMSYLLVNFKHPLLKRPDVRRALAVALDRPDIIAYKLFGLARVATSLLTPENPYFERGLPYPRGNLADARRAIERLGLSGQEVRLKTSNSADAIDHGRVLARQLARSGLTVTPESFEWGTFYADVKRGGFDLALMRWVGTLDPELYRMAFASSERPPGRNRGSFDDPEVDRALARAERAVGFTARKAAYARVQRLVAQDLAVIPLWYDEQVAVSGTRVLNFEPSLTSDYLPLVRTRKQER